MNMILLYYGRDCKKNLPSCVIQPFWHGLESADLRRLEGDPLCDSFLQYVAAFGIILDMKNDELCPCKSGKTFGECCKGVLDGSRKAETAAELMRARYSAYASGDIEFLYRSSGPQVRAEFDEKTTREWSSSATWQGLQILAEENGGPRDKEGIVEFVAYYTANGRECVHHERSVFERIDGEWRFIDGMIQDVPGETIRREAPKVGRNDPCPCGSGKKYKKCCGKT